MVGMCQADNIKAAVQKMVAQKVKGKIVFVSSLLGYASFAGYTNYSPGKYALRGQSRFRSRSRLHQIRYLVLTHS